MPRLTNAFIAAVVATASVNCQADDEIEFFERHIRPIFAEHCYSCHSSEADEIKAGLRLDTSQGWHDGGDSGPAVDVDEPNESLLLKAVRYDDDFYQMPPNQKLPDEVVENIQRWIEMGAVAPASEDPDETKETPSSTSNDERDDPEATGSEPHWAFQPPRVDRSRAAQTRGVRTGVDRFVVQRQAEKSLNLSPRASDATLVRRLYYDLLGLPPTFKQIEDYRRDPALDKYDRLVEQLLASPRFGERWARHWLDVARFADTKGYVFTQDRNYPDAFKYRDWVIHSFNDDRRYDEFVLLQLAADQAENNSPDNLAAMGYLTLGRRFLNNQHDIIDDRIDVVTRGLMGLTVTCARCHDHKYDPIPMADYYSLYGVFANSSEPGGAPSPLRMVDRQQTRPGFIFTRGNPANRGDEVPRQFLEVVAGPDRKPFQHGSGRLEMAKAIAADDNPLTARVYVNRVWGHLFGQHLVATPSDFGTRSQTPELLDLLDYLTVEFVRHDWSHKWLIREIVRSATYQQSVSVNRVAEQADPENRFYWRSNRRRLGFEAMRDSILSVCGRLDSPQIGGPSQKLTGKEPSRRRALYAYIDRQNLPGLFRVFDVALPDTHVPMRFETTVPQQALFLMNSPFILDNSSAIVEPWMTQPNVDSENVVETLFRKILSRNPTSKELSRGTDFIAAGIQEAESQQNTVAQLAQVLLLSNEFMTLD